MADEKPKIIIKAEKVLDEFLRQFIRAPYLCYTEHGLHALFFTQLYNALTPQERQMTFNGCEVCCVQKEYPTCNNLGKSRRQNWDIALIKNPPTQARVAGNNASLPPYDTLRLSAIFEFGLNALCDHLIDDIQRVSHEYAEADYGYIVHLYRLSSRFSRRDWSSNAAEIRELFPGKLLQQLERVSSGDLKPEELALLTSTVAIDSDRRKKLEDGFSKIVFYVGLVDNSESNCLPRSLYRISKGACEDICP